MPEGVSACDSYVGGWGKLQVLDSHSMLDFLPGQTGVNFNNQEGYLPAFEVLITHEADKFKLYLLPGRLALSQASAKYLLAAALFVFLWRPYRYLCWPECIDKLYK